MGWKPCWFPSLCLPGTLPCLSRAHSSPDACPMGPHIPQQEAREKGPTYTVARPTPAIPPDNVCHCHIVGETRVGGTPHGSYPDARAAWERAQPILDERGRHTGVMLQRRHQAQALPGASCPVGTALPQTQGRWGAGQRAGQGDLRPTLYKEREFTSDL